MIETPFGDKYQILEALPAAEGVEAYRATTAEGAVVAIKVVTPRDVEGFLDQARSAAQVVHPNVARVLEAASLDDLCFVVYDADGVDLGAVLSIEGKMPPLTVAESGAQVAGGLAAIHARGLVHGRIRPSTLIRTSDGSIKILDLGLTEALGNADLTTEAPATAAYYVSPEEVLARPLVPASDLYTLGVVLYELATARLPIDGADAFQVAERHSGGLVEPPRSIDPEIPEDLENVIVRALSKAPQDRYATARQMERDLRRVVAGTRVAEPRTSVAAEPGKRSIWPWILIVGAVALVATLAILWLAGVLGGAGVEVPKVVGLSVTDATTKLDQAGFTVGDVTFEPADPGTAQGTVVTQTPKAGAEADKGSAVDLVVAGTETGVIPDLSGMDQATATSTLVAAGFTLAGVEQVASADVAAGLVVSQSPPAGTLATPGAPVSITVSTGAAPTRSPGAAAVPDVTGETQAAAQSALQAAGYTVVVSQQSSATVPAGTVISQTPSAGVVAATGSSVTIYVSTGAPTSAPTPTPTPTSS